MNIIKKRGFWIIISIAIVIIVSLVLYLNFLIPGVGEIREGKINFSNIIESCKDTGDFESQCIRLVCNTIGSVEEKIKKCTEDDLNANDRDSCFFSIRPRTIEVCDNMPDSNYSWNSGKTSCYRSIAEKEGDDSICDKINDDIGNRVECYMTVARIKKDPEICQKIDFDYFKNWCSETEDPNVNLCMYGLKNFEEWDWLDFSIYDKYKDRCLGSSTGDISKCGDEETGEKYECYVDIAKDKNDSSICDEIKPVGFRYLKESCYLALEIGEIEEGEDFSQCDKIEDKGVQYYCYNFVIESAAEELNKNFGEEDQPLYDKYCDLAKEMWGI